MHNKSGLFRSRCRRVCFHHSCSFCPFLFVLRANLSFVEGIWFSSTALVASELTTPNLTPYSWAVCIFVRVRGEKEMSVAVIDIMWLGVLRKQALSEDRPLCDRFSITAFVLVHVMCPGKKRQSKQRWNHLYHEKVIFPNHFKLRYKLSVSIPIHHWWNLSFFCSWTLDIIVELITSGINVMWLITLEPQENFMSKKSTSVQLL